MHKKTSVVAAGLPFAVGHTARNALAGSRTGDANDPLQPVAVAKYLLGRPELAADVQHHRAGSCLPGLERPLWRRDSRHLGSIGIQGFFQPG